jgi:hypothetical protein
LLIKAGRRARGGIDRVQRAGCGAPERQGGRRTTTVSSRRFAVGGKNRVVGGEKHRRWFAGGVKAGRGNVRFDGKNN